MVARAVPESEEFPTAAAADAIEAGMGTSAWKLVTLNCSPGEGSGGDIVAVVVTSLKTTLPIGVPGQYSS